MYDEGVIKFTAEHRTTALGRDRYGEVCARLIAWREILFQTGLVGQDPARYGGAGYGNVSGRVGALPGQPGERAFLVTGTQTGGRACMSLDDFCVVEAYDDDRNWVRSHGPIPPSSESMTHGAIYDLSPAIRFVLHAHCPVIWKQASALRIPTTHPDVPYGTPEMAGEVRRLYRATSLAELRILSMGGHEDGIIVFGRTVEEAGEVMIRYLARAYEAVCAGSLSLCTPGVSPGGSGGPLGAARGLSGAAGGLSGAAGSLSGAAGGLSGAAGGLSGAAGRRPPQVRGR